MKAIKKSLFTILLILCSWSLPAQEATSYKKEVSFWGISPDKINEYERKSKYITFFDSTYLYDVMINSTIPHIKPQMAGLYYETGKKLILLNHRKSKYKVLKYQNEYLYKNILFGIIKERFYPTYNNEY